MINDENTPERHVKFIVFASVYNVLFVLPTVITALLLFAGVPESNPVYLYLYTYFFDRGMTLLTFVPILMAAHLGAVILMFAFSISYAVKREIPAVFGVVVAFLQLALIPCFIYIRVSGTIIKGPY